MKLLADQLPELGSVVVLWWGDEVPIPQYEAQTITGYVLDCLSGNSFHHEYSLATHYQEIETLNADWANKV